MAYDIWLNATAKATLESASVSARNKFKVIEKALRENPYPSPKSDLIRSITMYNRELFWYFDPDFPYVISYTVHEVTEPNGGFIYGLVTIVSFRQI